MSFGSMSSANSSLKSNRDSRRAKKDGFKSNNRDVSNSSGAKTELKFKEVPEEELKLIKEKIRTKLKRDRRNTIIITLVLTAIIVGWLYFSI